MKKKNFTKAFTIAMVSASLLAVGPASAVLAKNVGGGDWNYGYS
ncbi:hypothetical protein ACTNET_06660 [Lactobacillus amylovorus]